MFEKENNGKCWKTEFLLEKGKYAENTKGFTQFCVNLTKKRIKYSQNCIKLRNF